MRTLITLALMAAPAVAAVTQVVDQRDFWMGPDRISPISPNQPVPRSATSLGTVTTTFYFDDSEWLGADVLIDVEPWVRTYGPNGEVTQTIRITEWPIFSGLKRDERWYFDTEEGLVTDDLVWVVTLEGPDTMLTHTYSHTLYSAFDENQINLNQSDPWLMQEVSWNTMSGGVIDRVTVPSIYGRMLLPFVPEPTGQVLLLIALLAFPMLRC